MNYEEFKNYVSQKSEICSKWSTEEQFEKFFNDVDICKIGKVSQQLIDEMLSSEKILSEFKPGVSLLVDGNILRQFFILSQV